MDDLKARTIRGGTARMCSQAANFILRVGALMVLARLLNPKEFGLVGMVTALTGVLSLFRDFGLSAAAVQRTTVTEEQAATLFWINILMGAILSGVTCLLAPVVSTFYHEPRLVWITVVLSTGFLFNAAGVQHVAHIQREMRFTALATVDICSLTVSTAIGIGLAVAGYGYWALVAMTVVVPLVATIGFWSIAGWVPGKPRRRAGIRSMMRFGGTLTLNGLVVYIAANFEKILLGRFWGAEAIGLYGRAYQLIRIPTDNLNASVGEVAFSALSRIQHDPVRLKSYFLKGYSLVLALTVPITTAVALFADDMIAVLLGQKWKAAAPIFQLLAPTILVFAIANPLSWLLSSIGLVARGLKMALAIAPFMIGGYIVGLPYGPKGVAIAYSAVMILWVVPLIAWSVHGTVISFADVLLVVSRPLGSSVVAAGVAFGVHLCGHILTVLPRLVLESAALLVAYLGMLLFVAGQRSFYMDLLRGLRGSSATKVNSVAA